MDAIVEHSRKLIEKGSKSFAGAARLFDDDTRASAYMLYAWCRHCDDEIDGQELGFKRADGSTVPQAERLAGLSEKTRAAIAGHEDYTYCTLHDCVERTTTPGRCDHRIRAHHGRAA